MATPEDYVVGPLLREWREAAGMKLDRAAVYASDEMGFEISSEKVRRYEAAIPDAKMEPVIVATLTVLYGHTVDDLPPAMATRVKRMQSLLLRAAAAGTLTRAIPGSVNSGSSASTRAAA